MDDKVTKRLATGERRAEIIRLIEDIGLWNLPITGLAQKYGISRTQIYKDLAQIKKRIPIAELEEVSFVLHKSLKKALRETQKIIADPKATSTIKLKAINTVAVLNEKFTEFLEAYGYKERVLTEKPVINVTQVQAVKESQLEIEFKKILNGQDTQATGSIPEGNKQPNPIPLSEQS